MAATSTSNRDGQVASIVTYETRQPLFYEFPNVSRHVFDVGVCFEEAHYVRIAPGQISQLRIIVGIGKTAYVKHKVGIQRDAVLEPE